MCVPAFLCLYDECVCRLCVRSFFFFCICVCGAAGLTSLLASFQSTTACRMAAESVRVVTEEQEERPASGVVTQAHRAHTRSQSHIQFQPLTQTAQQWPAPRVLAPTRSHSHTHFSAPSHTQSQRYGCRLTHSLSAMTKGESGAQGSAGKLNKPTEPLFTKTPHQVRSFLKCFFITLPNPLHLELSHPCVRVCLLVTSG